MTAPVPRPNPELMVIGDSLPQGCRSLSVTADFCAQSWPARMAAARGWDFVTPDFPRPVLYQLEDEILNHLGLNALLHGQRLEGFGGRMRANLTAWLRNDKESQFPSGATRHRFSSIPSPRRISSRKLGSRAAAKRFLAMLSLEG
jgi:hypothetical protein